ncbi:hypothetical protein BACCAP_01722 [Pseudoflavonifractor capillosus ATCC 29799]|uniref:Uncharacterized protein n=1 Tax=Pseudoflavonifractor capillosus ATCC 29799 TaxID=411467 RepID=A6NU41_9FIRM|nr:hypothetical protein BACCAP_01722 [Pseudoflavonifractor capillosus ATCC 29799]
MLNLISFFISFPPNCRKSGSGLLPGNYAEGGRRLCR